MRLNVYLKRCFTAWTYGGNFSYKGWKVEEIVFEGGRGMGGGGGRYLRPSIFKYILRGKELCSAVFISICFHLAATLPSPHWYKYQFGPPAKQIDTLSCSTSSRIGIFLYTTQSQTPPHCICQNCYMCLCQLWNVFVQIERCICPNCICIACKCYLSRLPNVFVQ